MKTQLLIEEKVYVVSNHAVARNPIFSDRLIFSHFKKRMEADLSPLCQIINYCLKENEFQILIKLRERKIFEGFYLEKNKEKSVDEVPESGYIFSQQMSNLQVSLVKKYNYHYGRSGTLIATRYHRREIENVEEFNLVNKMMLAEKKLHHFRGIWENKILQSEEVWTGRWLLKREKKLTKMELGVYLDLQSYDLVGYFLNLSQKSKTNQKNIHFSYKNQKSTQKRE